MSSKKTVLKIANVSKTFHVMDRRDTIANKLLSIVFPSRYGIQNYALKDINFEVHEGDFFGIIGKNGSGKSTLLKIIMGSILPNAGATIECTGRMIRLALGMGFDTALTARDNIYLNGTILGMTFKEIGARFDDIISYAELEEFVDTPLRFYSSGLRSRLAFSIALYAEAKVFLIDEFFGGVGDENFKKKSDSIFSNRLISGKTVVFVSHFMDLIQKNCNRLLVIDQGVGHLFEDVDEGIAFYKNSIKTTDKIPEYG